VSAWEIQNSNFLAKLRSSPADNLVWVCPVTLGELECGLLITNTTDQARRDACRAFILREVLSFVHDVRESTRHTYALIMERIWKRYPPTRHRRGTEGHLLSLSVDINDVWIAAVALEHGLTLLTSDQMMVIRECVPELKAENWLL
jgi:tRNA(fMet)-specific endonuclease VapC